MGVAPPTQPFSGLVTLVTVVTLNSATWGSVEIEVTISLPEPLSYYGLRAFGRVGFTVPRKKKKVYSKDECYIVILVTNLPGGARGWLRHEID